ncbi:Actin-related protein 2/3 complex subunit 1A [Nymphon striatum]|nr:Actin-related protein 2/3 complex subunit 1A [Nymphon striatum]KAG1703636.1 Actin-related protein 2/3 complex subunit 1A [Nymphon striatum]
MTDIHEFGITPITCHAFNKDRTQVAISPNSNEVHVYAKTNGKWTCLHILTKHDLRVTSIDWAPNSNRIVSCAADRNAYVWTCVNNQWKPTLVLLRINRAATCVKWSPLENKFAVGSGASLDWHPNNCLLACGSTDFKARVFSGYIKEVDQKPTATPWGTKMNLGNLMAEFSNGGGGWVHSTTFSDSGNQLLWIGHDSSISIVDATKGMQVTTNKTMLLPFLSAIWVTEKSIVVAGHDCCPILFRHDNDKLTMVEKFDKSQKKEAGGLSAMKKFRDLDKRGATTESRDTVLETVHQNTINQILIHTGDKSSVSKFSTVGVDGKMVIWDVKKLINIPFKQTGYIVAEVEPILTSGKA